MIKSIDIKQGNATTTAEGPFDNLLAAIDMADMTPAHIHEMPAETHAGHSIDYYVCYGVCK